MNNLMFLLLFMLFLLPRNIMAETPVTVYCDDNYPPYSYLENGEVKGIYTEILKPAFSRMKAYDVQIEAVPYKRGLYLLRMGRGFALYPPYFRPETRPYIDYSVKILEEKLVVFLRNSIAEKHRPTIWPGDFYGLTIGKNHGFEISRDQAYTDAVKAGKLRIEEAASNSANILKLGMSRIDAYVNDRISVLWELNRLKRTGRYDEGGDHEMIVEGISLSVEHGHLAFTNRDGGRFAFKADFIKEFNAIIDEMKRTGRIEEIVNAYLK